MNTPLTPPPAAATDPSAAPAGSAASSASPVPPATPADAPPRAPHDPAAGWALWRDALVLAPMTVGSNLPYRRLCKELGADVCVSEAAMAKQLLDGQRKELALLRRFEGETPFVAQLVSGREEQLADAARLAVERGADAVDLNSGCPINPYVERGLGAALLQRPVRLGRLLRALRGAVSKPVSVKIRLGWSADALVHVEVARMAEAEGMDAITVHGRTREARYTKAARWDAIGEVVAAVKIPVIGNGDLLTPWEATRARAVSGCAALMFARGALIKPWVFREVKQGAEWLPTAAERLALYQRYATFALEHFGDDERGRNRVREFLRWHFGFWTRYRPLPRAVWEAPSLEHPLLQTRYADDVPVEDPLERLLRRGDEVAHAHLARAVLGEVELLDAPPAPAPLPGARVPDGAPAPALARSPRPPAGVVAPSRD